MHWNGFLLPLQLQTGPGFLLQQRDLLEASLPAPLPRDTCWPSAGPFAICLAIIMHTPQSST